MHESRVYPESLWKSECISVCFIILVFTGWAECKGECYKEVVRFLWFVIGLSMLDS